MVPKKIASCLHATPSHHQYSGGSQHYSQSSSSGGSSGASYLHHGSPQLQQHVDPYVRHEYRRPSAAAGYALDDEHYYYVATLQNRMAQGKHIPVTEL